MINHVFISFSAVQIYDLSYIHLYSETKLLKTCLYLVLPRSNAEPTVPTDRQCLTRHENQIAWGCGCCAFLFECPYLSSSEASIFRRGQSFSFAWSVRFGPGRKPLEVGNFLTTKATDKLRKTAVKNYLSKRQTNWNSAVKSLECGVLKFEILELSNDQTLQMIHCEENSAFLSMVP